MQTIIRKNQRIPFNLCDAARIMFFGAYLEIYHTFLESALPEMGINWDDWFVRDTGAPVRAVNVDYQKPLAFGQLYQAELSVEKLTDSTVTFSFKMGTETTVHAEAKVTHCFVDFKTRSKAEIPAKIRTALES